MHNNNHHTKALQKFGEQIPFCEPYVQFNTFFQMNLLTKQNRYWYQGFYSPYYRESHVALRKTVRDFVEREVKPNIDDWVASDKGYPTSLHVKAYKAGVGGLIYPREYGYVFENVSRLFVSKKNKLHFYTTEAQDRTISMRFMK